MAQQRVKFVRETDGGYIPVIETDTNTLTAQPVALDSNEDFRLIIDDSMSVDESMTKLQDFISAIRDGQTVRNAVVL